MASAKKIRKSQTDKEKVLIDPKEPEVEVDLVCGGPKLIGKLEVGTYKTMF